MRASVPPAALFIALLLVVTPFVVVPDAKEAFRLPQGLVAGWLGLASLAAAAYTWAASRVGPATVAGSSAASAAVWAPALHAVVPLVVAAAISTIGTAHPWHASQSMADLAIGAACLVGWSLALSATSLWRLLLVTIPAGVGIALLVLDQAFGLVGVLGGLPIDAPTARLRLTATLGNPGDVGAYLVLPLIVAASAWSGATVARRRWLVLAFGVIASGMLVTGTLASLAALAVAMSVIAWSGAGAAGRTSRLVRPLVLALVAIAVVTTAVGPIRARVVDGFRAATAGDVNALLSGRLDGWRAATRMWRNSPATGVGQGAFRAEYADTRLILQDEGARFFEQQHQVMFATPHNEWLSVAAETGALGVVALAWGIWQLLRAASTLRSADAGLGWAGLAALAVLSAVWFPFHAPAVTWPWLLFLAWLCRRASEPAAAVQVRS